VSRPGARAAARPRQTSLVGRLIWLAAGWSVAVLLLTGAALIAFFTEASISRFDQGLKDVADGLYAGSSVDAHGAVIAPSLIDARALRVYSGKYWQLAEPAPGGKVHALVRSRSLWDSELAGPTDKPLQFGSAVYYDTHGPAGEPLRATAFMSRLPGRAAPVVFMAAEDRSSIDRDVRRFALRTAIALVLLGAGIVGAVVMQVRVGMQPLFRLRREITLVRKGRAEQLTGDYPAELSPLAEELNALVAHNQEVVERQRTHVGNLAHALKTPLSVMMAEAGTHPGPLAEVVGEQAEAMRRHVDHHLRRARTAARSQGSRDRTLVEPVIDELASALERIFQDRGVVIDWRAPEELAFQGERQDLLEIAGNIMENACKWARGKVRVTASGSAGEKLSLVVEDDGPGLAAAQRAEMLKRGVRLDETSPGSGLGLSIVDELARAYGGSVELGASEMGGLKVSIVLPRG
jgi:signal transduction histidine kinase